MRIVASFQFPVSRTLDVVETGRLAAGSRRSYLRASVIGVTVTLRNQTFLVIALQHDRAGFAPSCVERAAGDRFERDVVLNFLAVRITVTLLPTTVASMNCHSPAGLLALVRRRVPAVDGHVAMRSDGLSP